MGMATETFDSLFLEDAAAAWDSLRAAMKDTHCEPISGSAVDEIVRREKHCEALDLALSGAAWTLWKDYYSQVPLASRRLIDWWAGGHGGKAALVLDGLSLRELPVLLKEAKGHGFEVEECEVLGSELPAETTAFAKALGFSHRGALDNNGAGGAHHLPGAFTLSNNLPWADLVSSIPVEPKIFVWHHWPDHRIHEFSDQGDGIRKLLPEVVEHLTSGAFWSLVAKLAQGREVVITSDHGYANVGAFRDADAGEKAFFQENFGGYRYRQADLSSREWLPPLALTLDCPGGRYSMALGRVKWAVQGGNRTLSHGGLSLFEAFVPFVRLRKP